MTCTSYCKKIEEIFDAMIRLSDEVLPENRKEVNEYIWYTWMEVTILTSSIKWEESTEGLRLKFQSHVDAEEERLRKNLDDIKYDIDGYDSVHLISHGRIETVRAALTLRSYLAKSRTDTVPDVISSPPERLAEDQPCSQARSFRIRAPRRSGHSSMGHSCRLV